MKIVSTILFMTVGVIVLVLNLYPRPQTLFDIAKEKQDHKTLAQIFLQNNDYLRAKEEFKLAGIDFITEPEIVMAEITKWEKLIIKYPNYRDGYIKLAILYWKISDFDKTKNFLSRALELDPNHPLPELP